jgi:hypothetical protein
MSQPPGGYQPPGPPGAPPPAGPPGGPPPPPSSYPPSAYQPGYPAATRPGSVTAAAVLLIILGAVTAIGGIFIMVGGGALAGTFGGLGGVIIVVGVLALTFAVFEIISGIKILGLSPGWRIAGIVLCAIGAVFSLISLIGSFSGGEAQFDPETLEFSTGGPNIGGIIFNLLFLAAYVVVIVLLARSSQAFARR